MLAKLLTALTCSIEPRQKFTITAAAKEASTKLKAAFKDAKSRVLTHFNLDFKT
jgi:hypothetical protein